MLLGILFPLKWVITAEEFDCEPVDFYAIYFIVILPLHVCTITPYYAELIYIDGIRKIQEQYELKLGSIKLHLEFVQT